MSEVSSFSINAGTSSASIAHCVFQLCALFAVKNVQNLTWIIKVQFKPAVVVYRDLLVDIDNDIIVIITAIINNNNNMKKLF